MTVFNPTTHPDIFSTGPNSAERLWSPDKLAAVWKASGLYDIVIQTATPAVADQGKVWFQPHATNAAPGAFKYWNGASWVAMTTAQWKAMSSAAGGDAYTAAVTAPTTPKTGDWWKNTSAATVSGVAAGATSFWNGTSWEQIGSGNGTAI